MDSPNSDGSGALALEPMCQTAAQELLMRSYIRSAPQPAPGGPGGVDSIGP